MIDLEIDPNAITVIRLSHTLRNGNSFPDCAQSKHPVYLMTVYLMTVYLMTVYLMTVFLMTVFLIVLCRSTRG